MKGIVKEYFEKRGKLHEIRKEWRKLLQTASFEPLPLIEDYLDKRVAFEAETGWCFPHPSVFLANVSIADTLIRNAIREAVKDIRILEENSEEKISKLGKLLNNPKVTSDLLSSVVSKDKLSKVIKKCEREFAQRNREDLLSQVNDVRYSLQSTL